MLDEIDYHILDLLQDNGRYSNAAIAEQVGLTTSSVFERIKKLENRGVIRRYVAIVDGTAVGKPITAFIRLAVGESEPGNYQACKKAFTERCLTEPDILECHSVAGEDCYILKVRATTTSDLETLLERLRTFAPILRSTTNIVLSTFKESSKVQGANDKGQMTKENLT